MPEEFHHAAGEVASTRRERLDVEAGDAAAAGIATAEHR